MNESTIIVAGMTCGNCVKHVTEELLAVPGITQVRVDLVAGGASPVVLSHDVVPERSAIAAAVDEAGYTVTFPEGT